MQLFYLTLSIPDSFTYFLVPVVDTGNLWTVQPTLLPSHKEVQIIRVGLNLRGQEVKVICVINSHRNQAQFKNNYKKCLIIKVVVFLPQITAAVIMTDL